MEAGEEKGEKGEEEKERERDQKTEAENYLVPSETGFRLPGNGATLEAHSGQQCLPPHSTHAVESDTLAPISVQPPSSCVTPGMKLNFSEPQLPHREKRGRSSGLWTVVSQWAHLCM